MNSSKHVPTHHSERVSPVDITNKLKTIATQLSGVPDSQDVTNTPATPSTPPNHSPSKWERCRDGMKALQQLASEISFWGGDQRLFVSLFEDHIQEELIRQVKDLQAHTIKEACSTISAIMPVIQNHSPSFLSAVLPVLFSRMTDIEVSFIVDDCVKVLLKSAGFASVAKILLSFLSHSHEVVRAKCTTYMIEGMAATPKEDLEKIDNGKFTEILGKEIPLGLDDPETRISSEELFREFRRKWPELAEKIGSKVGFSPPTKRPTSVPRIVRSDGGGSRRPKEGGEKRSAISAKASPRSRGLTINGSVPSVRDSVILRKSGKLRCLSAQKLSNTRSSSGLALDLSPIADPYLNALTLAEGRDRSPPNIVIAAPDPDPDPDPNTAPAVPSGTSLIPYEEDDFVISLEELSTAHVQVIDILADSEDMLILEESVRNRTPGRIREPRQIPSSRSPSIKPPSSRKSNRSRTYLRTPSCDYVIEDDSPGYSPRRNTSPDPRNIHRRLSNDYVIEDYLPRSLSHGGVPLRASVIRTNDVIDDEGSSPKVVNRIGNPGNPGNSGNFRNSRNSQNVRKITRQYSEDAVVEEEVTATLERSNSGIWEKSILESPFPKNSENSNNKHSDISPTPHYDLEDDVVLGSSRSPKMTPLSSAFGLARQRSTPPSLRSQRPLDPLAFRVSQTWVDNSNDVVVDVSLYVRNFLSENDSPFKLEGPGVTPGSPLQKRMDGQHATQSSKTARTKNIESEDEILEDECPITFRDMFHPEGITPPASPAPKTANSPQRWTRLLSKDLPREPAFSSRGTVRRRPKKRPKEVDDADAERDGCEKNIPFLEKKRMPMENTEESSGEGDGDSCKLEEVTAGLMADM